MSDSAINSLVSGLRGLYSSIGKRVSSITSGFGAGNGADTVDEIVGLKSDMLSVEATYKAIKITEDTEKKSLDILA